MPRLVMKWYAPLLIALFVLAWTPLAGAQTTPSTTNAISNNLAVSAGGVDIKNAMNVWIGKSKCSKDVTFKFTARGYSTKVPVLELWATNSATTDCSTVAARSSSAMGAKALCWLVQSASNVQMGAVKSLEASANRLFSEGGKDEACVAVTNQQYGVHLVPLMSATQEGTGTAPAPLTTQLLKAIFTLYTKTPKEPGSVKGVSGESSIGVTWKDPPDADTYTKYRVYYDVMQGGMDTGTDGGTDAGTDSTTDAGTDGTTDAGTDSTTDAGTDSVKCGSGMLLPGKAPPRTSGTIIAEDASSGSGSLSDLDGKLKIGQFAQVGVVTVDAAGNESVLSEVVCVKRVETNGFLDKYNATGDKGLDECSVHAPGSVGWGSLGCLTVLALTLVSRRRRAA